MDIVMLQTIPDESLNGGRTKQTFVKDARYEVSDEIGQLWIGRGWAKSAAAKAAAPPSAPARPAVDRNGNGNR